jgi:hypothetical protein
MTSAEIAAALQAAFQDCDTADAPLTQTQKQILLEVVTRWVDDRSAHSTTVATDNPLDALTEPERQILLQFIQETDRPDYSWKVQLLNDWLQGQPSGAVQFVRERYGLQWLEQVQPFHVTYYLERDGNVLVKLKVGDRIEVCNALWEWVQESGPCDRQWFPCTVIQAFEEEASATARCIVRFDNGSEYEIQGIYDWNRYNWRWIS